MGIRACQAIMPNTPQVAVFDTAFHMTMPPVAYRYAIPTEYYKNDSIRRYGFTPQVAVFDTAFHMTMPPVAYRYAIPTEYYKNDSIRRYGFHGTSHKYVTKRACELMGTKDIKLVNCHLGNGSSMHVRCGRRQVPGYLHGPDPSGWCSHGHPLR